MAFEEISSIGTGQLPFAKEYLNEHPKEVGKVYYVTEIVPAKSGKGYTLYTDKFVGFIWKNSSESKTLMPIVEEFIEGEKEGFAVMIKLSKNSSNGFLVGFDRETPFTWIRGKDKLEATKGI